MLIDGKKTAPFQLGVKTALNDHVLSTTADLASTVRSVLENIGKLTPHNEDGQRVQQQVQRELSSRQYGVFALNAQGALTPIDPGRRFDELGIVVPREVTTADGQMQTLPACLIEVQAYAPVGG